MVNTRTGINPATSKASMTSKASTAATTAGSAVTSVPVVTSASPTTMTSTPASTAVTSSAPTVISSPSGGSIGSVASDVDGSYRIRYRQIMSKVNQVDAALDAFKDHKIQASSSDVSRLRQQLSRLEASYDDTDHFLSQRELASPPGTMDVYFSDLANVGSMILDLRIRVLQLDTPAAGSFAPSKIDQAFKPDALEESATPAEFDRWKSQFKIYMRRNGIDKSPKDEQRIMMDKCLTPSMASTLRRVCQVDDGTSIDDALKELAKYFQRSNNLITRRLEYHRCDQQAGESLRAWVVRFRNIGDFADFDNYSYKDNLACRLVQGCQSDELRKELLKLPSTDFDTLYTHALAWEAANVNLDRMRSVSQGQDVCKVSTYKSAKSDQSRDRVLRAHQQQAATSATVSDQPRLSKTMCLRCGGQLVPGHSGSCYARNVVCHKCHIRGHLAKVCQGGPRAARASGVRSVDQVETQGSNADDDASDVNVVTICQLQDRRAAPRISITLLFSGQLSGTAEVVALPDTGASASILPAEVAQKFKIPLVSAKLPSLRSVNKGPLHCLGQVQLRVKYNDIILPVIFYVCTDVPGTILSWFVARDLGLVPPYYPCQAPRVSAVSECGEDFKALKAELIDAYPPVFCPISGLPTMTGNPMRIRLKDGIDYDMVKQPTKPRSIPIPLRDAAKLELDKMVSQGIIRPVCTPTQFVSPFLVVPKPGGKVRLVVDYTTLNKYVSRPIHPFPSVSDVRTSIPPSAKYFATLDAVKGYWQVPLHPDSQEVTTFLTPWGRFCYLRAPMGLNSSGDEFCLRGDQAFASVGNMIKVVDDVLVFGSTLPELRKNVIALLEAAKDCNITLSPDKFVIGTSVRFVGLQISHEGVSPDVSHLKAIKDFPLPRNKTDLRSFFGLINQFSTFTNQIATMARPLRPLLSKDVTWNWLPEHDEAFCALRNTLVAAPVLRHFDVTLPTRLVADASRLHGLGFALLQSSDGSTWHLVACGSRFVSETESNYAVCELEALAIVWAVLSCRVYLMGLPGFTVITDHRPLVSIFNDTRLAKTDNPRLIRLLHKVTGYDFQVEWTSGRCHRIADALSRAPVEPACFDEDDNALLDICSTDSAVSDPMIDRLIETAQADSWYQDLRQAVLTLSLSDVRKLPVTTHAHVRLFISVWGRLSLDATSSLVLLDGYRIVVPAASRGPILHTIHVAHQGVTRTKARVSALYFWPGMANEVVQLVQGCHLCQRFRDSQPAQPLMPAPDPMRPFEMVSADLFEYKGSHTLVYTDRFSGWPLLAHFGKLPTSSQLLSVLRVFFRDYGIPVHIRHDGATPFVSEQFVSFLKAHNVRDEVSSAYNPQSNGHAESSVKAMKLLVKKCWRASSLDKGQFDAAVLEWRNTPRLPDNLSPAELVFGRKLRGLAPCLSYGRMSNEAIMSARNRHMVGSANRYEGYNLRRRHLPLLAVADTVRLQNPLTGEWDKTGRVVEVRESGLSYIVEAGGKRYLRNRRFLKKNPEFAHASSMSD